MKRSVLDSYAVLSFLFKEKGHEKVLRLFEWAAEQDTHHLISAVNWAEIRYIVERKFGKSTWLDVRHRLSGLPLEIVSVEQDLAEAAGEIKVNHKMSVADCFAAALAKQQKLGLYTGDPEFKSIESEVDIHWL